jgi:hypothetical protein
MKYKIYNIRDLLTKIQYEGIKKGVKTETYLEDVIRAINRTGKYEWVQFFQLIDILYVVVRILPTTIKNPQDEIRDHYSNVENEFNNLESAPSEIVKQGLVSLKTEFPWKK